ncbi:MAG: NAD(P)/FAD-dependent oxidoreductase, partial [Candidatus Cryptobacteroides sp.]|nr:NAD(P)/FAD-dependent oxidoreductase [Candidatus Cryptobacteroides sp.]
MHYDIIIIGGGAAGLMAAIGAGTTNPALSVLVLEKMPRPGRKIVITGKGRCNFTNLKDWGAFAPHVRANSNVLRA